MPEIGLFGSEGGAPTHGVPTLSAAGKPGRLPCERGVRRDALLYLLLRANRSFDYPFYPSMSRLSAVSKASRLTFPG